jgi:cysteine desulfurase / selenocysteine lyase
MSRSSLECAETKADPVTIDTSQKPRNLASTRDDFPALAQKINDRPLVYLDNAATSQKPTSVLRALREYYERDNANVHRAAHTLSNRATAAYEGARERAARFLNARRAEEIVWTRGTTEAINLVANTWGEKHLRSGDVVLLTEMEHHSNIVPWQLLAARTGAKLAFLPINGDEGVLDLSRLDEWLTREVKLLAVTHISNSLGTINPVDQLCSTARKRGIVTLVDAAQSAGHRPVDVQEIGCDFLALSGHKMCGPTGIGLLYGRGERLADMPPWQGGGDMIETVDYLQSTWKLPPQRFEAGTPNISGAVGIAAAMDYLDSLGRDRIATHDAELAAYALDKLSGLEGIRLLGPKQDRAGVVSFLLEGIHAHDVVTLADHVGIALRGGHHCNQPLMKRLGIESTSRASFYFYNTTKEIDLLAEALAQIQSFFARRK